jgi:hypothetical protein
MVVVLNPLDAIEKGILTKQTPRQEETQVIIIPLLSFHTHTHTHKDGLFGHVTIMEHIKSMLKGMNDNAFALLIFFFGLGDIHSFIHSFITPPALIILSGSFLGAFSFPFIAGTNFSSSFLFAFSF